MVIDEFVKIGFNEEIASDIANRYYRNEVNN
ncbi:Bdr family repetitive protein [Borrelia turcica]|nr:Bdr family repetitive protein [Borrelia turcica]